MRYAIRALFQIINALPLPMALFLWFMFVSIGIMFMVIMLTPVISFLAGLPLFYF